MDVISHGDHLKKIVQIIIGNMKTIQPMKEAFQMAKRSDWWAVMSPYTTPSLVSLIVVVNGN
ncbi:MAG: hypothetical protein WBV22_00895 [Anaerolineaceae bacterium]